MYNLHETFLGPVAASYGRRRVFLPLEEGLVAWRKQSGVWRARQTVSQTTQSCFVRKPVFKIFKNCNAHLHLTGSQRVVTEEWSENWKGNEKRRNQKKGRAQMLRVSTTQTKTNSTFSRSPKSTSSWSNVYLLQYFTIFWTMRAVFCRFGLHLKYAFVLIETNSALHWCFKCKEVSLV